MVKDLSVRLTLRRDTTEHWNDPKSVILQEGEIGYDIQRKIFKIGDGSSHWTGLRVTFQPFSDLGLTVLSGGDVDFGDTSVPVTLTVLNDESPRYSETMTPLKGEIIAIRDKWGQQHLKVGTGTNTLDTLPYVTPIDDARINEVFSESCEGFRT